MASPPLLVSYFSWGKSGNGIHHSGKPSNPKTRKGAEAVSRMTSRHPAISPIVYPWAAFLKQTFLEWLRSESFRLAGLGFFI